MFVRTNKIWLMRNVLLETAIDHFGIYGFEGASTRAIAADCGTAMSSITYHFGGKEGLYLAVADHIAEQIALAHGFVLAAANDVPPTSREDAIDRLLALLDGLAAMMLSEDSARWARFITREQQEPTEAFERIYATAMQPLVDTFVRLIAVARPDLEPREQRATGFLLFGQAMALRAGRASLCRVVESEPLDAQAEALMRRRIAANARTILFAGPEIER